MLKVVQHFSNITEYYHYETIAVLFYSDLLNPPWLLNATDGPYATY